MNTALLAIHLLAAAAWVGGLAFAVLVLRPSVSVLQPAERVALSAQVFRRFFLVLWHAMPIALLTGYALVFTRWGGFDQLPWAVNAMQLCGLLMAAIFLMVVFGPWKALRRAISTSTARAAADKIRLYTAANLVLGVLAIIFGAIAH